MISTDPLFFGYGSLVNRATHGYRDPRPAVATGWRRAFRSYGGRRVAVLTAVPDPASEIEGLVAAVPGADWAALDLREAAYNRVDARASVRHDGPAAELAIYTIPDDKHPPAAGLRPILLSYLDVVIQGYLREFGAEGAQRFFATTDGWEAGVLDDRAAPVYPRHQPLTDAERAVVDAWLHGQGVRVVPGGEDTLDG